MNVLLIFLLKIISRSIRTLNLGNGSTWPGHLMLFLQPHFISSELAFSKTKVIFIIGTNGKTTTSKLLKTILKKNNFTVIQNTSGANLMNGIASALISNANVNGKITADFALFEIDENIFPLIVKEITPSYIVLLNLFRDQLDRYGEVRTIIEKWKKTVSSLPQEVILICNGDDPQIAYLGSNSNHVVKYFGLDKAESLPSDSFSSDSLFCPKCFHKLTYSVTYFSHLGKYYCKHCSFKRPKVDLTNAIFYPLPGTYNEYNILASELTAKSIGIPNENIENGLKSFKPAFGRQEIIQIGNKKVQIFLSKNPTSFNQSLQTIQKLNAKHILFCLNDRIPDGRDISWIWDTDLSLLNTCPHIYVSGDRVYDMALRIKYEGIKDVTIVQNIEIELTEVLKSLPDNETLYILPTYTAMLEIRKIILGKKIL